MNWKPFNPDRGEKQKQTIMDKDELIKKWETELEKWKKVYGENSVFHTIEERRSAVNYASVISLMLSDIKQLKP